MWGSTQSFGAARLKSMFLLDDLDVNLNDSCLMFHASASFRHTWKSVPSRWLLMIIMNFRPKKEGEGQILKLAMGQT
jgi:hypothetical protein